MFINLQKAIITKIITGDFDSQEVEISVSGVLCKAVCYSSLTGKAAPNDEVLINTTAVDLSLGTGGVHFILYNLSKSSEVKIADRNLGHIMKLRYTPLQHSVISVEEDDSPYRDKITGFKSLNGKPVIVGQLHSQLPAAAMGFKSVKENARIIYIMTDSAALPITFSRLVKQLKNKGIIQGTITIGQAFGGDIEAVNIYTGIIAAFEVLNADAAIVIQGPGNVGTDTKFGFSGIEMGDIVNAISALGGTPFPILRISFADSRERHHGISHHSITALKIARARAEIAVPELDSDKMKIIIPQLREIENKHTLTNVNCGDVPERMLEMGIRPTTMGRGVDIEKEFFLTAAAAGIFAGKRKYGNEKNFI